MPDTTKPPSTAAQRKASERANKRSRGLRPLEVWARPEHHHQIKRLAETLSAPSHGIDRLRIRELQDPEVAPI